MKRVQLNIIGLSNSQTKSGAYALILGEENGNRRLPIIIGAFEAQAIFIALEKDIKPPRPLTHDLFQSFATSFEILIKEVIIHKIEDGVFYSSLVCLTSSGEKIIDARTSDAIALAVRFNCKILTYENILKQAGIILDQDISNKTKKVRKEKKDSIKKEHIANTNPIKVMSIDGIKKALEKAIKNEDYEKAAKLRDELNKRKTN